jgi:trk system potassium uptake protein
LLLIYGFGVLIILGMILLILPASSASGQITSPLTALFTSVSAVSVTGLVVVDTGTYWSTFGQAVLLALFQIGGLGFITGATLLLLAINRRFGLKERLAVSEAMGSDQLGSVTSLVITLALSSLIIEFIGSIIFYFRWSAINLQDVSLWTAIFHSVSALNNCGMDVLTNYQNDGIILITTAVLAIIGSTGYVVFADIVKKRRFRRLSLDSKTVLVASASLLVLGTIFYLISESSNPETLGMLSFPQNILVAFFQSVTPRTAGFSSIDIGNLRQISLFFTMFLMFVGGAAGSTAGGVKVNSLGVLWVTVLSVIKGRSNIESFERQLSQQTIFRALTLFVAYLAFAAFIVLLLSLTEIFPFENILFEVFSALSTVGLSTGITPDLTISGKFIIIIAMFVGRLGPLALMAFLVKRQHVTELGFPHESIRLG